MTSLAAMEFPPNGWWHAAGLSRWTQQVGDDGDTAAPRMPLQRIPARCVITHEGDPVDSCFALVRGWIALTKILEDGNVQIIDVCLPDDMFFPTAGDGVTSAYGIEALTDVALFAMAHSDWERLKHRAPPLRDHADRQASLAAARRAERMLRLGRGSAAVRIAYALLELHIRIGATGPMAANAFHLPMSQHQIGNFVGLSSVHVCRTLRRFSRNGLIATSDHLDVTLCDIAALSRIANVDLARLRAEIAPAAVIAAPRAL